MKKLFLKLSLLSSCICLLAGGEVLAAAAEQNYFRINPVDTGEALINPSMGWTAYFYSNVARNYGSKLEPSDTLENFPGVSTVYLRLPWAYLEPEEGTFNWAMLDTPAQRWIAKGKRIVLRLTCSENWMQYATPKWVKDAGAKGTFYRYGKGRVEKSGSWDPFFDDPVFLEKLNNFLAAASRRYDGNVDVDFIDVGTYGLWGEGHTHASSQQDEFRIKKLHIDLHLKHFKNTLLCISDDFAGHDKMGINFPITDYALSQGVTVRDDSIMVQPPPIHWRHAEMAELFSRELPVVIETGHYGNSVKRNAWSPERFLQSVEDYHASYMSIHWWPHEFLEKNREVIDKINRRLGYRLLPTEVTWPKVVSIASTIDSYHHNRDLGRHGDISTGFKVQWKWINQGVAPCYPGGFPTFTLKDAEGGIVAVLTDESLNMRQLKVGLPGNAPILNHESEFRVGLYGPTSKPGTYDLYLSVGKRDGTPTIALPLKDDDGQHRYRIGSMVLKERDG